MIARDRLIAYLDELLDARRGRDFGPNGLQVEGRSEVTRIASGVSGCQELFERAAAAGADTVLVHHGIFWEGDPRPVTGFRRTRLLTLLRHDINLLAYHLPLDRHPQLGNNAVAARAFGLEEIVPFADYEGLPIGFRGRFARPIPATELVDRCRAIFDQAPLTFLSGPEPVRTLGIVSGGAQRELHQAIAAGLDAYLTGEVSEWVMNVAREAGIHYLAAGHYATERLGIRALGEHLKTELGLEVEFIDVPNPA